MLTPAASPDPRRAAFSELKARLHGARHTPAIPLDATFSSGFPELDRMIGGGFPRGMLVTLEGDRSSGRWSIVAALLATVTHRGLGAVIDEGELYPPGLAQVGVRLERLLIVRARTPLGVARAVDILLRSRVVRLIVMPATTLRAAVWTRLAGLAHKAGALLLVIAGRANAELVGSAGMRLGCTLARIALRGTRGIWCTFAGFTIHTEIRKHKRIPSGAHTTIGIAFSIVGTAVRERTIERPRLRAAAGGR